MYFHFKLINTSCTCCTCHASTSPQFVIGACADEVEKHVAWFLFSLVSEVCFPITLIKVKFESVGNYTKSYLPTCILNSTAAVKRKLEQLRRGKLSLLITFQEWPVKSDLYFRPAAQNKHFRISQHGRRKITHKCFKFNLTNVVFTLNETCSHCLQMKHIFMTLCVYTERLSDVV